MQTQFLLWLYVDSIDLTHDSSSPQSLLQAYIPFGHLPKTLSSQKRKSLWLDWLKTLQRMTYLEDKRKVTCYKCPAPHTWIWDGHLHLKWTSLIRFIKKNLSSLVELICSHWRLTLKNNVKSGSTVASASDREASKVRTTTRSQLACANWCMWENICVKKEGEGINSFGKRKRCKSRDNLGETSREIIFCCNQWGEEITKKIKAKHKSLNIQQLIV